MWMPENKKTRDREERIIKTRNGIDFIKKTINDVLDKNHNMCKYWENVNEPIWGVSFRVDESQYMAMIQTSFEISVKLNEGVNVIRFSNEMVECDQWSDLYNVFLNTLA